MNRKLLICELNLNLEISTLEINSHYEYPRQISKMMDIYISSFSRMVATSATCDTMFEM